MGIFEIYGQQKTLTQWDLGRKMIVHDSCNQVHYANALMTEAIVCQVQTEDGLSVVPIPDEMLQTSGTMWVYAYLEDGESCTRHIETFFVKARPKPADYVFTPTPGMSMEQLMARLDALEEKTETDPTVPAWAKKAQKPAYTAAEVGARADTWLPTLTEIGAAPVKKAATADLSAVGWYRIGEVKTYNCYRLTVSTIYNQEPDMAAIIDIVTPISAPLLYKTVASFSRDTVKAIDQIRLVQSADRKTHYVDMHYSLTSANRAYVLLDGANGWFTPWTEWEILGEDGITPAVTLAL